MKSINPLYIIPARGGSKGIVDKNIVDLSGRPLIQWTLDAVSQIASKNRIIVSTDSERIAGVVRSLGYDTPYMRPAHLATDTAGSREVIIDVMDYADRKGLEYDCVVLLQPTSPLRTPTDIVNALALYSSDIDMVVTVTEASANPYYDLFECDANGMLKISKGDGNITRRQDAPRVWQYNGAVYVINPKSIRAMALGEMPRRVPSVMPRERSIDIDSPVDLAVATLILKQCNNI